MQEVFAIYLEANVPAKGAKGRAIPVTERSGSVLSLLFVSNICREYFIKEIICDNKITIRWVTTKNQLL